MPRSELTQPSADTSTKLGTKVTDAGISSVPRMNTNTALAYRYGMRARP